MDFDLSEEQRLLKESVDGLLGSSYDFDSRKKYMSEKGGWSKGVWSKFAEQGLLGLPFSEDDGGFGAGAVETMIVMEALGKALVLEPYLATVVIGGGFLRLGGSAAQKAAHIGGIIDGSKTFAFAQLEKNSRYDLGDVATSAKKKGGAYVIDGEKFVVLNGEAADTLIVTARTNGGQREASGIGVFLVPGNAKGVAKKSYPTQDGLHAADVTFTGVEIGTDALIGDGENGLALIERVVDEARTALCAEAVGLMDEFTQGNRRISEDAKAVRRADRQLPDPAASRRRHVRRRRTGPQHVDVCDHGGWFRRCKRARHRGRGGESADRQVRKVRRPAVDPASRRHRHDHGGQDRPLLQAADHDREHLWRHRLSSAPRHRGRRAGVVAPGRQCEERSDETIHSFLSRRDGLLRFARDDEFGEFGERRRAGMTIEETVVKNTPFDLTGKVAIITGSSRGIGRSSAELLAKLGAKVVISSRKVDACQEVADGIRKAGGEAHVIPCNISRREEVEVLIKGATLHYGRIDILVCNAAVNPYYGPLLDIKDDAFDKIMAANVKSNIWLCQLAIPQMAERGSGSVVIISSIGGLRGSTVIGAYGISKAADFALCRSLAGEWGPKGVRVNCVAPGLVKTDFARALWEDEERLKRRCATTPLRRIGEPDEIAGAVAYLGSDASSFMTGQTIVVDGGVTTAAV